MEEDYIIFRSWITVGHEKKRIYAKWYGLKAFRLVISSGKNDLA